MRRALGCLLFSVLLTETTQLDAAEPVQPPIRTRLASAAESVTPDFQKHVVPLLSKLGCSGRSCHGSFQGRGGFRLSLFGYDFQMDHAALTGRGSSDSQERINREDPAASLLVRKPSLQMDHEGGRRFETDSWEHRLLLRWIAAGAPGTSTPAELTELTVVPSEVIFDGSQQTAQLRVTAVWADGSREDVTSLCRFRTNQDSIATVDIDGQIRSGGPGDTHVIVFYDNGVTSIPILTPYPHRDRPPTETRPDHPVDRLIVQKLNKLRIEPAPVCTDSEFLRRVSIDLTGTLPTPDEVKHFLSDSAADKRLRKVDELLQRPAYAAWWTNKLCDFTGCNPSQQAELGQDTSVQWYKWLFRRLQENQPYDDIVADIVLARGRAPQQSYDDYTAQMSSYFRNDQPADFAERTTLPHYWTRRSLDDAEDKALAFAHNFLGIRLQCAQCHKHPFAPWTQEDFGQFAQFFEPVRFGVASESADRYRELAKTVGLNVRGDSGAAIRQDTLKHAQAGRVIPWRELYIEPRDVAQTMRLLRSRDVTLEPEADPRQPIMDWMREPSNPWFSRAFVNRVWASYFHVGIVEPPDELNPSNPPSHPELLDWLSREFIQSGYDMRWLHRQIVSSDTYQRSWKPNATNRDDRRNFSRAIPRRIPAEVVYDALKQATAGPTEMTQVRTDLTRRATGHLSMRMAGTYAMHVFGKPERAVNCDCERVNSPTLLQAVFLQNDPLVDQRLANSQWLAWITEQEQSGQTLKPAELIREAWLRTVSRPPTLDELKRARRHFEGCPSTAEACRDLLWALLNTKEFILNH